MISYGSLGGGTVVCSQEQHGAHSKAGCHEGGCPAVVGLFGATSDENLGPGSLGGRGMELEFPHLVAGEAKPGPVIPLEPDPWPSPRLIETRIRFERCRK